MTATHQPRDSSKVNHQRTKLGGGPISGILPLINLWSYPAHKNEPPHISRPFTIWDDPHSIFGMYMSLNKFTSITLSLTEFSLLWDIKNLNFMKSWDQVKMLDIPCVLLSATPWTEAHKAPVSMGFSRQKYWSGLPCPPPGDLLDPGTELRSLTLQADSLPPKSPEKMRRGVQS